MPPSIRSLPQVCALFLCASVVSVCIIYLLNAEVEARKRKINGGHHLEKEQHVDQDPQENPPSPSFLHPISISIRSHVATFFQNFQNGVDKLTRGRRSVIKEEETHHHRHKKHEEIPPIECYTILDVLVVVGITCLVNFGFVGGVWWGVRWVNGRRGRTKMRFGEEEGVDCPSSDEEDDQQRVVAKSQSMEDLKFYTRE